MRADQHKKMSRDKLVFFKERLSSYRSHIIASDNENLHKLRSLLSSCLQVTASTELSFADFSAEDSFPDILIIQTSILSSQVATFLHELSNQHKTRDMPVLLLFSSLQDPSLILDQGLWEDFLFEPCADDEIFMRIARLLDLRNERQSTNHELHLSRERFDLLSRATNDAVWDWDLVNNLIYWSENVEKLFGYPLESVDLSPQWWYDRLHPEDRERVMVGIHRAMDRAEEVWSDEYRFRKNDGTYAYIFDRGYVVVDPKAQKSVRMIGTMQDLTERENAKRVLQQSHKELERKVAERTGELSQTNTILNAVIEGTNDIVYVKDLQGRYILINKACAKFIGRPKGEILGETDDKLFDVQTAERIRLLDQSVITTGEMHNYEGSVTGQNGLRTFLSVKAPYRDSRGNIIGVIGISHDITERKEGERQRASLQKQQKWFDALLNLMPTAIVLVEPQTARILFHNKAADMLTGGEYPEDVSSTKFRGYYATDNDGIIIAKNDLPRFRAARGEKLNSFEMIWHTPDDSFPLLVFSDALPAMYGHPESVILTFQDIRKLKETEAQLKKATEIAQAASRAKTRFLANMSHEIRTPLAAILGYTDFLAESNLSAQERQDYVKTIKRNGELLLRIINDVLDLSKIEAEKLDIEESTFCLQELLRDVISLLNFKATEKGIALNVHWQSDIPKHITSDPTRLRQVLINVIGNAIKFTERGSVDCEIRVLSQSQGNAKTQLEFVIRDTGIGIAPEQQKRLFQPFVQADSSMARRFGGTGLGLSLSRRIATALGGELTLTESQLGKGTVFTLKILVGVPKSEEAKTEQAKTVVTSTTTSAKVLEGLKLLLAEDAPDNRLLFSKVLKHLGADVDVACDGQEAVNKAMATHFDAVLMDIQMPGLDGYEATDHLRARGYDRPIIALTAHAMKEERLRSLKSGFNDYITKPIDRGQLIASLKRVTEENRK